MRLDRVCSAQIWTEALGRKKGDARRTELLEITNVLKRMPGWTAGPNRHRLPGYGPQLVFTRTDLL
jgi:putative DNA primase/helicase